MKLPHGERAIVEDRKLYGFLVNPEHPEQPGHAELFRRLLGIDRDNAEELRSALLCAAREAPAVPTQRNQYGEKYEVVFPMRGKRGTYRIISVWLVNTDGGPPRLITAFPEKADRG